MDTPSGQRARLDWRVVLACIALLVLCAAVAQADTSPAPDIAQPDTDATPVAKPAPARYGLARVGGAIFGGGGTMTDGSPVPYAADLYATAFADKNHGLAAGAACADPAVPFDQIETVDGHGTGTCGGKPRVPVVYM